MFGAIISFIALPSSLLLTRSILYQHHLFFCRNLQFFTYPMQFGPCKLVRVPDLCGPCTLRETQISICHASDIKILHDNSPGCSKVYFMIRWLYFWHLYPSFYFFKLSISSYLFLLPKYPLFFIIDL